MEESNDLKPGQKTEYKVGDQIFIIEPRPYGVICDMAKLFLDSMGEIRDLAPATITANLPELIRLKVPQLMTLAFDPQKHSFLTEQWLRDNMSFYDLERIMKMFIRVNKLDDFLEKMFPKKAEKVSVRELKEEKTTTGTS